MGTREGPVLIGENALKVYEQRTADVFALTQCKCLILHQKQFFKDLDDYNYLKMRQNEAILK